MQHRNQAAHPWDGPKKKGPPSLHLARAKRIKTMKELTINSSKINSQRTRLANRRPSETFSVECAGLTYLATVSQFPDGRLGEIFITSHKVGSAADTAARDAAIACSIALQFGADVEIIRKALCRDSAGNANGPLAAALDLIAGGEK